MLGNFSKIIAMAGAFIFAASLASAEGTDTSGAGSEARGAFGPQVISGQLQRYYVPEFCNAEAGTNRCGTIVEIYNADTVNCSVGVEFYRGREKTPTCTITDAALPKGLQSTMCSRAIGDPPASCQQTCPAIGTATGYAIIYSNSACDQIAVQATIYTQDSTGLLTSAHKVNIVRRRPVPDARANQGD